LSDNTLTKTFQSEEKQKKAHSAQSKSLRCSE